MRGKKAKFLRTLAAHTPGLNPDRGLIPMSVPSKRWGVSEQQVLYPLSQRRFYKVLKRGWRAPQD